MKIGCSIGEGGRPAICVPNLTNGVAGIIFGTLPVNTDPNANNTNNANNEEVKYTYSIIDAQTKQKIGLDATEIYSTYINNEREYIIKIIASDGTPHRINVYDAYSKPPRTKKTNATTALEAEKNNNSNSASNNTNTTTNNNTTSN